MTKIRSVELDTTFSGGFPTVKNLGTSFHTVVVGSGPRERLIVKISFWSLPALAELNELNWLN